MNKKLQVNNIYKSLTKAKYDSAVDITIAYLIGDKNLSFYAAQISSKKKIKAHYHTTGSEFYQIIEGEGEGEIHIGKSMEKNIVKWTTKAKVKKGDCFIIQAEEVHQLVNTQNKKLIILCSCPKSHLADNRIIV